MTPLSVGCPPSSRVVGQQLELQPIMNSRSFTQGFWCQLLSSPGLSLTSPLTGAAAVLFLCYSVSKSHKMFQHFDLYVLCHGKYLLFFCHAAVIRVRFGESAATVRGPFSLAQQAKKILPSCMTSSSSSLLILLLLFHVKVVFYCTSAPVNKHLNWALGYAALSLRGQHEVTHKHCSRCLPSNHPPV